MTLSDNFLLYAFVSALCIIGIHASTWEYMINNWVNKIKPFYKSKPEYRDSRKKTEPIGFMAMVTGFGEEARIEENAIPLYGLPEQIPTGKTIKTYYMSHWVSFPLWECPICMASVWGLSFSWLFNIQMAQVPVFCLTIAGINTIFVVIKMIQEGDKRSC